ncbi:MAG: CAP domain-containing protein [Neobacillus sp.]
MIRLLTLLSVIFLLNISWPTIEKQINNPGMNQAVDTIEAEIGELKNNPELFSTLNTFFVKIQQILGQLNPDIDELTQSNETKDNTQLEKIELNTPEGASFSVHNIQIGDSKEVIDHELGAANRSSLNEYNKKWYTYHDNYQNFFMVMYDDENKVAGLFTNQDLIASTNGIKLGSPKQLIRDTLGEPETKIKKGLTLYQLQENSDYDLFVYEDTYLTIFYDKHEEDTVTALQIISKDLEDSRPTFYSKGSSGLKEGFEYQMFDLTNATRVNHELSILTWDDHVRETARKHSLDMAENQYFDHTNLQGKSPFDRMSEDNIVFLLAGENLATGQLSSIYAHEGLMNSLGHRKNILAADFEYLGVGVAFNEQSQPYYTQKYYAK